MPDLAFRCCTHFTSNLPTERLPDLPSPSPDWAQVAAEAAQSAATATWVGGLSTLGLLFFTGLTAWFAFRSLTSWRRQVHGELELQQAVKALMALHDLKAVAHNMRLPVIFEGQGTLAEISQSNRKLLGASMVDFTRETIGVALLWGETFQQHTETLSSHLRELALASNYVHEKGQGLVPEQYWILGLPAPHGVSALDYDVQKDHIARHRQRLDQALQDVEDDLTTIIQSYSAAKSIRKPFKSA